MKTKMIVILLVLVGAASEPALAGETLRANDETGAMLQMMRQEEKLARDVYRALNQKWSERVFANISRAEQKHMEAVGGLLQRYGLPDPVALDVPGQFPSDRFQGLYDQLVQKGSTSRIAALQVGMLIEEMDIADLQAARQKVNRPDVDRVLQNLERGSRNHLRAFANRLNQAGGSYAPRHLSTDEFNRILASSETETGRRAGKGGEAGRGRQRGRGQRGRGQGGSGQGGRGQGGGDGGH